MILILILLYHCFLHSAVRSLNSKVISGKRVKVRKNQEQASGRTVSLAKRNPQEKTEKEKKA